MKPRRPPQQEHLWLCFIAGVRFFYTTIISCNKINNRGGWWGGLFPCTILLWINIWLKTRVLQQLSVLYKLYWFQIEKKKKKLSGTCSLFFFNNNEISPSIRVKFCCISTHIHTCPQVCLCQRFRFIKKKRKKKLWRQNDFEWHFKAVCLVIVTARNNNK